MTSCVHCEVKLGYSEANAARDHDGLCVGCYVKSLVKEKSHRANKTVEKTNLKSLDGLFHKYDSILVSSETAPNLRIRKRFGVVHGEASLSSHPHKRPHWVKRLFKKQTNTIENHKFLKQAVEDADIELKANAIKKGANAVVGYDMQISGAHFGRQDYLIISVSGTAVEIA